MAATWVQVTGIGPRARAVIAGVMALACGQTDVLMSRRGGHGAAGGGTSLDGGADAGRMTATGDRGGTGGVSVAGNGRDGGGSAGTPDPTRGAGGSAGSDPQDPHAAERKRIVDAFCAPLETYPCLTFIPQLSDAVAVPPPTTAEQIALCSKDTQSFEYMQLGDLCLDEWGALMKCVTALPKHCPCTNDCNVQAYFLSVPTPCPVEEQALEECAQRSPPTSGETMGSLGPCLWNEMGSAACTTYCPRSDLVTFGTNCVGSSGGPQACTCLLNDVPLHDDSSSDLPMYFYADDCAGVAQAMSDGQCDKILNCCFTWTPQRATPGQPLTDQCSCVSDPKLLGFDTCADIAARGGGKVVDLCPQFPPLGSPGFP